MIIETTDPQYCRFNKEVSLYTDMIHIAGLQTIFYLTSRLPSNLTPIGPGKVKVELANFDLKLQENLLSN